MLKIGKPKKQVKRRVVELRKKGVYSKADSYQWGDVILDPWVKTPDHITIRGHWYTLHKGVRSRVAAYKEVLKLKRAGYIAKVAIVKAILSETMYYKPSDERRKVGYAVYKRKIT